jgi:hypothetical protein
MAKLYSVVKRGKAVGTTLTPHLYAGNYFIASKTRFESDYVRVPNESQLLSYVRRGFSVRMSNPDVANHRSPSLVAPSSIAVAEA